jgi:hypothetical protein
MSLAPRTPALEQARDHRQAGQADPDSERRRHPADRDQYELGLGGHRQRTSQHGQDHEHGRVQHIGGVGPTAATPDESTPPVPAAPEPDDHPQRQRHGTKPLQDGEGRRQPGQAAGDVVQTVC